MKTFLIRRSTLSLALCGVLACLMFTAVNYPAAVNTSAAARQLPIYCVQRDQKLVSVSFDAAWGDVRLRQGIWRSYVLRCRTQLETRVCCTAAYTFSLRQKLRQQKYERNTAPEAAYKTGDIQK